MKYFYNTRFFKWLCQDNDCSYSLYPGIIFYSRRHQVTCISGIKGVLPIWPHFAAGLVPGYLHRTKQLFAAFSCGSGFPGVCWEITAPTTETAPIEVKITPLTSVSRTRKQHHSRLMVCQSPAQMLTARLVFS